MEVIHYWKKKVMMMEVMKQHYLKLTQPMPPTPIIGKSSPIRSQEDQVHSITAGLIEQSSFPRLDTFTLWVTGVTLSTQRRSFVMKLGW